MHNGTTLNINNVTGELRIRSQFMAVFNAEGGGEQMASGTQGGSFERHYDGVKKFETRSDGVDIHGLAEVNGDVRPNLNNTHDLGTSSLRWANVYTNDLNLSNEGGC